MTRPGKRIPIPFRKKKIPLRILIKTRKPGKDLRRKNLPEKKRVKRRKNLFLNGLKRFLTRQRICWISFRI